MGGRGRGGAEGFILGFWGVAGLRGISFWCSQEFENKDDGC